MLASRRNLNPTRLPAPFGAKEFLSQVVRKRGIVALSCCFGFPLFLSKVCLHLLLVAEVVENHPVDLVERERVVLVGDLLS